ncbi:GAF domain-containing protein [Iningainema sp. BLCCT55]|uniref:histidine kinase n=1 Tax=Iningainema tapete BLCC-T55 TaxID=2748662 RepID=A0A8J6XET0_9CYAN|nr:GAF domain-containing protein [Iningainema tapete BLCC-T55]
MKTRSNYNEAARLETLRQYQILDTDPEEAFDNLTRLAAHICGTPIAFISFIDENRQWFKSKVGLDVTSVARKWGICPQCSLLQNVVVVSSHTLADECWGANPVITSNPDFRFYAGVCLVTQEGYVLGHLCVMDYKEKHLNPEQLEGLRLLGRQVLAQLEIRRNLVNLTRANTEFQQAGELLQQQRARERLVTDIAHRIRQSLNLEAVLNTTVSQVRQFLQTERVFIYRFEPDWGGVVVVESVANGWKSLVGSSLKDPDFAQSCTQSYKQGRLQATTDIYTSNLPQCYIDFLAQFQVRATLVVPILQGEQLWGLLVANHCSSPRQWQQLEIDLLVQLATQLAIALQQSQLYQQTQYQLKREQALNQVIQTIRNSLDLKTIFSTAVFEIAQLLQADRAHIVQYLPQRQIWLNVADYCRSPNVSGVGLEIPDEGNEIAAKLKRLEVVRVDDASTCTDEINRSFAQTFPGAWLLIPLHFGSAVWGSLGLVRSQPALWQPEEVELTSAVADQIAIAIQQSTLLEQIQIELNERKRNEQKICAQRLESLGTLARGMAHEINNKLAPILMSVQLLKMKLPDEQSQGMLQILESSVKSSAALVKQVLLFAHGVEGDRTILLVLDMIKEVEQIAKQTFPKSIQILTDLPDNLWTVSGDATQLKQVLINLAVNARDAMPDGGILRICAKNLSVDENYARINLEASVGAYVVITVSDTGMGIEREILERIFDPFFTTKEVGKGTGLGLSTVMGIIKSHGGFVNVASEVGLGSQFQVYLPAVREAVSQPLDQEMPTG